MEWVLPAGRQRLAPAVEMKIAVVAAAHNLAAAEAHWLAALVEGLAAVAAAAAMNSAVPLPMAICLHWLMPSEHACAASGRDPAHHE